MLASGDNESMKYLPRHGLTRSSERIALDHAQAVTALHDDSAGKQKKSEVEGFTDDVAR